MLLVMTHTHTVLATLQLHSANQTPLFLPRKEEGLGREGMHASVCVRVCVGGCERWDAAHHDN